jgi:hypothetical protein
VRGRLLKFDFHAGADGEPAQIIQCDFVHGRIHSRREGGKSQRLAASRRFGFETKDAA